MLLVASALSILDTYIRKFRKFVLGPVYGLCYSNGHQSILNGLDVWSGGKTSFWIIWLNTQLGRVLAGGISWEKFKKFLCFLRTCLKKSPPPLHIIRAEPDSYPYTFKQRKDKKSSIFLKQSQKLEHGFFFFLTLMTNQDGAPVAGGQEPSVQQC